MWAAERFPKWQQQQNQRATSGRRWLVHRRALRALGDVNARVAFGRSWLMHLAGLHAIALEGPRGRGFWS